MALMYGRRPPKNAPALRFASFLSGRVPEHPSHEDYLAKLPGWQMLGNDAVGDCNAVTWANLRRLVTASLATEYYPTQAEVYVLPDPESWLRPDGHEGHQRARQQG